MCSFKVVSSVKIVATPWGGFMHLIKMDGWMTCDFTSFSTVFQSYQGDGRLIMKGCVQWNSVYG